MRANSVAALPCVALCGYADSREDRLCKVEVVGKHRSSDPRRFDQGFVNAMNALCDLRLWLSAVLAASAAMPVHAGAAAPAQAAGADEAAQPSAQAKAPPPSPSTTSNTTTANDTARAHTLGSVVVKGRKPEYGGGLMGFQSAPKAVSTVDRAAIVRQAPGSNFTQAITSIPGVNASTDDVTGLSDGNFSVRGFTSNEVGVTVNGAPISDAGNYSVFATEYGDTENYGDITVEQGLPDLSQPDSGASGGHIAWATINPSHDPGVDFSLTGGSHDYGRGFVRFNTGDTGPVRSWLSYSYNAVDKWRGAGDLNVYKIDGKSIWTIDENKSIAASLQFNHEVRDGYLSLTQAQVATCGYHCDYDRSYVPGSNDTNFYALHGNRFRNYLFSLDGEFQLSDNLHLAVIPYFQYGEGGGGGGNRYFTEVPGGGPDAFGNANQDLNQDGQVGTGPNGASAIVYRFSHSTIWRPGIIVRFKQYFGEDNSLQYGFWYERPRQQQWETYGLASYLTGVPFDAWGKSSLVTYADGRPQWAYDEYTRTTTSKIFATDNWTPNDQWTLSFGLAWLQIRRGGHDWQYPGNQGGYYPVQYGADPIERSFSKLTPALGLRFSPGVRQQFYYGLGQSFRAPPNTAVALNDVIGRADNLPESAWNQDLGWRYYGPRLAANVMLYRSAFRNKTITGFDQASGQVYYTQIPRLRMQGVNVEASLKLDEAWKLYASYTRTAATLLSELDAGADGIYPTRGKQLFNTPRNIAYAAITHDDGKAWASLHARYRSSIFGDFMNTERVGGYATFGLDAGYRFPDRDGFWLRKAYVKLNVFNLLDHHAFSSANNAGSYLASNPGGIQDANGTTLYASAPYYSLLEPRTLMVTFGGSF